MGSVNDYQERAKQCSERAEIVTSAIDSARWRELAEGWAALDRLSHNAAAGFWHGKPRNAAHAD